MNMEKISFDMNVFDMYIDQDKYWLLDPDVSKIGKPDCKYENQCIPSDLYL